MKKRIMCIDPGASGGIAIIYPDGVTTAIAMPDDGDLRDEIESFAANARTEGETPVAYLEIVGGFIAGNKLPGSAMFNFGSGYGYTRGLLAMSRVELHMVRPQDWQKGIPGIHGVKEKSVRKRAMKEHASRLFPHLKVTLKTSDALCIADYARRIEGAKGANAA